MYIAPGPGQDNPLGYADLVIFAPRFSQLITLEQFFPFKCVGERDDLVVYASDSGSRGRGFEPHSGQTVLCP